MALVCDALFRDNAYLKSAEAKIIAADERGLFLDRTVFYATSGGQPGDSGVIMRANGERITISNTITCENKDEIIHLVAQGTTLPEIGETVTAEIDWERRLKLMRMHAACHLLSVVCPYPITGAAVGEEESRVDFDLPDASVTREGISELMMELVHADHPIFTRWITEEELIANPDLVKSKNVRPPAGAGHIRLVCIGENGFIDTQPCGGTHVASTAEIGKIHIGKIEKKGRENRRFRIRFGPLPQN